MKITRILAALALTAVATAASATTASFTVFAQGDSLSADGSFSDGLGLDTGLAVSFGDLLTFDVDASQTWATSGTDANYIVNANGNASGQTIKGLYAGYGALVGQIGSGSLFIIGAGTNTFTASDAGELTLYAFDSDAFNNSGSISGTVSAVPEPTSIALILAGLGLVGFTARRRSI